MNYNKVMKSRQLRLILLIFWLILAGLIVWLKVVPGGAVTYSKSYPAKVNFLGAKDFIGQFTPADRVKIEPNLPAKISGDPVYFSVTTPRTFSQAKITITYQDNLSTATPIISAGVLVDNIVWRYKLKPLENKILDNDLSGWVKLSDGDVQLFQKDKKFSSVAEFLNILKNKPTEVCATGNPRDCLALYNADSLATYLPEPQLPKTIPSFKPVTIPLQGTHQFYFVGAAAKDFNFNFDLADLNLNKQSDPVTISLYYKGAKIFSKTILDNFGGETSGRVRNFSVPLTYKNTAATAGLYKIEIKADDDVVIKKITDAPSALIATGYLHPVNASSLPLSFWTDSFFVKVTANNPASLQTLTFGANNFSLSEAYKQFEFENHTGSLNEIKINRDDLLLETDGLFSFAAADFWNPEFKEVDRHFSASSSTKYILAVYKAPIEIKNNLRQAVAVLNTKEAYRENGKYSFMLSVPGLSLVNQGSLLVKNIQVEFSGRTLWDKIKEKISTYVN
ncbi:MAG: hypothetical protein WCK59_00910 [Candidatus Falkowbacteria bacterium]